MIPARVLIPGVAVLAATLAAAPQRPGSNGRGPNGRANLPAPPRTWKEHWFEHEQEVRLVASDAEVAVYYDDKMPEDEQTAWIVPFMSRAWRYTRATYGNFGPPDRLFAVFHQGRYGGGHPSTYFDKSHENRNVTDCGTGTWSPADVDLPSHEIGHIVEGANNGVHESPAFDIWRDSKWIELYQYDLYLGLGMQDDAQRVFAKFSAQVDRLPPPRHPLVPRLLPPGLPRPRADQADGHLLPPPGPALPPGARRSGRRQVHPPDELGRVPPLHVRRRRARPPPARPARLRLPRRVGRPVPPGPRRVPRP